MMPVKEREDSAKETKMNTPMARYMILVHYLMLVHTVTIGAVQLPQPVRTPITCILIMVVPAGATATAVVPLVFVL